MSAARDQLTITLFDLKSAKPSPGHYMGIVYLDEIALAVIHLLVTA